jgi:hypothetical protein
MAGLSAYGDAENALGVSVDRGGGLILWRREKNAYTFEAARRGPASLQRRPLAAIHLRMQAREGHLYRFAASADGRTWIDLGEEVDGAFLPPWDRGVRVALVAGNARGAAGRFDSLRIEPSR